MLDGWSVGWSARFGVLWSAFGVTVHLKAGYELFPRVNVGSRLYGSRSLLSFAQLEVSWVTFGIGAGAS